jgi:hypothetical protein
MIDRPAPFGSPGGAGSSVCRLLRRGDLETAAAQESKLTRTKLLWAKVRGLHNRGDPWREQRHSDD